MRLVTLIVVFIGLLLSCGEAAAQHSFLPDNDLHLEDNFSAGNLSKEDVDEIIAVIQKIYEPITRYFGGTLRIGNEWGNSTVNAYANRVGRQWNVVIYGGLSRRPEMNKDGLATIICHELGHHFGGYPLWSTGDWASNEGQSDYYAANVCASKYFATVKDYVQYLSPVAVAKCKKYYSGWDLNTCYHTMSGAKSTADLLGYMSNENPEFETPSKVVVRKTMNSHPPAQCRLDTMVAAAVCMVSWNDKLIPTTKTNAQKYNCLEGEGARPRCWYKP